MHTRSALSYGLVVNGISAISIQIAAAQVLNPANRKEKRLYPRDQHLVYRFFNAVASGNILPAGKASIISGVIWAMLVPLCTNPIKYAKKHTSLGGFRS